ncbi:MAG: GNAT family N-acetyltransferase [Cyclobacteriaceae bacterium]|nr:GNAT family N-acetyltransferase [Cyclobacteriaceae bacterium]
MSNHSFEFIPMSSSDSLVAPVIEDDFCREAYESFKNLFLKDGYSPPWISYFVWHDKTLIAVGGYKGPPENNRIEIAYGTVPEHEGKGYATMICKELVAMALKERPNLRICARTLIGENASTKILQRNGFKLQGVVNDPEDGEVWEWELEK